MLGIMTTLPLPMYRTIFGTLICLASIILFWPADAGAGETSPWLRAMGGAGIDEGFDLAVDGMGNVYLTGSFNVAAADFDPGAGMFELTPIGAGSDAFVVKLDSDGNFVWAKQLGGADANVTAYAIATDSTGNVYVTGEFDSFFGTVDFDPGAGTLELSSDGRDVFVVKLDPNGDLLWAHNVGDSGEDKGKDITVDAEGVVYVTGHFQFITDFDPDPEAESSRTSAGLLDIFVWRLSSDGDFIGVRTMGGLENDRGTGIAVDSSGNIYATGSFRGTADFDPGQDTFEITAAGGSDIFVTKLNASGTLVWVSPMGGTSDDGMATDENGPSVTVDDSGNVYATGSFEDSADFDPTAGSFTLMSNGNQDIFITKLDSDGNLVWAKGIGGTGDDEGLGIDLDSVGNVYTTGGFRVTADFDPGAGVFELTAEDSRSVFISKLNNDGEFIAARGTTGSGSDFGEGIVLDSDDNIHIGGRFNDELTVGLGTTTVSAVSSIDIFALKLPSIDTVPEDINHDGVVNAVDVQLVINGALGIPTKFETDVNGDMTTNAVDVQLVINAALGL